MTIAAGILAVDGVVLAADTKESYGETHTYVDKITTCQAGNCVAAIAGSGDGYLLDYITPQIQSSLAAYTGGDYSGLERILKELMASIYKSDTVQSYPKENISDLYTQFLITVKMDSAIDGAMFVINSTLVTQSNQLGVVIGCGPLREIGEELGFVGMGSVDRAKAAALCVVHEAKRRYSDVGGKMQLVSIDRKGKLVYEDPSIQAEKELLVDSIRELTNRVTVSILDHSSNNAALDRVLRHSCSEFRALHRKTLAIHKRNETEHETRWNKMLNKGRKSHIKRLSAQTSKDRQ